jgi:hypothetical protein
MPFPAHPSNTTAYPRQEGNRILDGVSALDQLQQLLEAREKHREQRTGCILLHWLWESLFCFGYACIM